MVAQAPVSATLATSPSPPDPTLPIRQSPLYREAQKDCRIGRYAHAAGLLDHLAATPGMIPEQVTFCHEQRDLCLRDAHLPIPTSHPVSSNASVSATSAPLTPEQADCGPRALALACDRMGIAGADVAALRRAAGTTGRGTTWRSTSAAARTRRRPASTTRWRRTWTGRGL